MFDDLDALKRGMPNLWKKRKEEIKKKHKEVKLEGKRQFLKEKKERKIERRRLLEETERIELNNAENNLSKSIDNNLNRFNENFLLNFFELKKKEGHKKALNEKKELFKNLTVQEKTNFYLRRMNELGGLMNEKITQKNLKTGWKKKDLTNPKQLQEFLEDINKREKDMLHHREREQDIIKVDTEEIDNFLETVWVSKSKEEIDWEEEEEEKLHLIEGDGFKRGGLWNTEIDKIMHPFNWY